MTTLIAWAAIDDRSTSAVYMASDSRLTWEAGGMWDSGRKIFASEFYPEILGYSGDAVFCTQVLGQIVAYIDSCAPLNNVAIFEEKYDRIKSLLVRSFSSYPKQFCLPGFSVFYLTRIGRKWGGCTFSWSADTGWAQRVGSDIPMSGEDICQAGKDENSKLRTVMFVSAGSGGEKFREFYLGSEWSKKLPLLSRGIFGAFCDFIETNHDPMTGGTPQISCLYRSLNARKIGFVKDKKRYLYGIEISPDDYQGDVRWVNRIFENCLPSTGNIIPGGQRQPAPYSKSTRQE